MSNAVYSIEMKNVSYVYSPNTVFEKQALRNINMSICKGEFVGLIGHTGSGKSTLIQHLNALVTPTSGQVLVNGEDIFADKSRLKAIRCKVGVVFQYPEHQLFETTVQQDVAFGPKNMNLSQEEVNERVNWALSLVGLPQELYERSPFDLSGGQRRRVAIAGVLAMKPEVLVLDEPTAGLDPRARDSLLENIKHLHKTLGMTVLLVSHSMEDIAKFVCRIVVLNKGEIAFFDTPKAVFCHEKKLAEMGLFPPQTTQLMNALREKGFDAPMGIFTADDAVFALSQMFKNR